MSLLILPCLLLWQGRFHVCYLQGILCIQEDDLSSCVTSRPGQLSCHWKQNKMYWIIHMCHLPTSMNTFFKTSKLISLDSLYYCKSLIFHGYYILRFSPWTLFCWNLISRILHLLQLQCTAKLFARYLISRKQCIHEINPMQNSILGQVNLPQRVWDSWVFPVLNSPNASVIAILSIPPPNSLLQNRHW